ISLSFLALATRTSWPHSSSTLLAQGEWVPASIAMRIGGCSEAKRRLKVSGLVRSADPQGTAHLGGRPSHLIFGELRKAEVRRKALLGRWGNRAATSPRLHLSDDASATGSAVP